GTRYPTAHGRRVRDPRGGIPPPPVVVPILVAAGIAAFGHWLPRRVVQVGAVVTAAGVAAMSGLLLVHAAGHRTIYWFSGWRPSHSIALGIDLDIDQFGAEDAT